MMLALKECEEGAGAHVALQIYKRIQRGASDAPPSPSNLHRVMIHQPFEFALGRCTLATGTVHSSLIVRPVKPSSVGRRENVLDLLAFRYYHPMYFGSTFSLVYLDKIQ